jgi:hypothetical protein
MNKTFAFIAIVMLALITPASAFFFFGYDTPTYNPGTGAPGSETVVDGDGSETPVDGDGSETVLAPGPTVPGTTPPSSGFDDVPDYFDTPPGFTDTPPVFIPGDFPAVWNKLHDVAIPRGTPTGTIIYKDITKECRDPDANKLTFKVVSNSPHFDLAFVSGSLAIFYLNENFVGTETVKIACNGIIGTFKLNVYEPADGDGLDEDLSLHVGSIRIPNQFDAIQGDLVPVVISIRNNGDKRLDDLIVSVSIAELGIRAAKAGPFDLAIGKRVTKLLYVQLPENVEPGTYYARITMDSSNGMSRTIHRDIDVIE